MEHYRTKCPTGVKTAAPEDTIMQKGRPATAGSGILKNFIAPFDATVVTRLEEAGIHISGQAGMDEFGIAGLFEDAGEMMPGAVSAVAEGTAGFALCNDYTGSTARRAAMNGLCYIHPTYGTVSRYGLIPAAASMDQIGIVCKNPIEGFEILSIIAGHDPKDGAMDSRNSEFGILNSELGRQIIGIPVNVSAGNAEKNPHTEFTKNFNTVNIELKFFDIYPQVMQILCCAEISNNINRYDGIKFGYRAEDFKDLHELYTKSRTEAFGQETKLALITGAMVLSKENYEKYYDKAMRIRRLIKESLEFDKYNIISCADGRNESNLRNHFAPGCAGTAKYDIIALPATGAGPRDKLALHALPRLCGLPAVTIPSSGGGITLIADAHREDILIEALRSVCQKEVTL